jgi:Arc/MetJ family transcription regulator
MIRRTTIEIDQELLERAKAALGESTTRGTVEAALRQVAEAAESHLDQRARAQRQYLQRLSEYADLSVLASEEMWR